MPDSKRIDFGSDKRIGNLPESLLSHILSFLPTKDAAITSAISKQWRFLFAFASRLEFTSPVFPKYDSSVSDFMDFVDRVLSLRGEAIVNKLSLNIAEDVDGDRATVWILRVLELGVSDLEIETYDLRNWSGPPPDVFVASRLVRLKLGMGDERIIDEEVDIDLPSLKTLHLDDVQFEDDCDGLSKLLSGCPVLEELIMTDIKWHDWEVCCVSSATLKRLEISWEPYDWDHYDDDEFHNGCPKTVRFDTPSLLWLEYTDDHIIKDPGKKKYSGMRFDSLVGAKISLTLRLEEEEEEEEEEKEEEEEENVAGDAIDFLQGICHVEDLVLSSDTLKVLAFCGEQIPVFNSLSLLDIKSSPKEGWESLPALLGKCPNLETLGFRGVSHRATDTCGDVCVCKGVQKLPSCLSASPVKDLVIFECEGAEEGAFTKEAFTKQIRHFLDTMPNLEEVIVNCQTSAIEVAKMIQEMGKKIKCKTQVVQL